MGATSDILARLENSLRDQLDSRALRERALEIISTRVPFVWFVWALTDPETFVGTSPLARVPSLPNLGRTIALRYQSGNRWTSVGVRTLEPGPSQWRDFVASYGVRDIASLALVDQFGGWGFLDLWRDRAFSDDEIHFLEALVPTLTKALRTCQAATVVREPIGPPPETGAVLVLSPQLEVRAATGETEAMLRRLLPTAADRAPVPAGAFNVGAQLLAREKGRDSHPAAARTFLESGHLVSFRAERLGQSPDSDIAVTVGPVAPHERRAFFALACALSPREREVLECLAEGADTRTAARRLSVSEFTIQDHLKSISAKTGVRSRRLLLARALG